MNKPNILIVIPARGKSKSITKKNLRVLNKKPLIYYSINNALNIKYKADVFVSSDDDEILKMSKKFGSKTIKREKRLATDKITLGPVIYHALNFTEKSLKKKYDIVIMLQPTSPTLKTNTLNRAIKLFLRKNLDTVLAACVNSHHTWHRKKGKFVKNFKKRFCRQYKKQIFRETGAFYITKRKIVGKENWVGKKTELFILKEDESIDINSRYDWAVAEFVFKERKSY